MSRSDWSSAERTEARSQGAALKQAMMMLTVGGGSAIRLVIGHPVIQSRPHDAAGYRPPAEMMQCKMTLFQDFPARSVANKEAIVSMSGHRDGVDPPVS
jgi:hypothetical protein